MQKTMSQADSVNLTCLSKLMQNYQAEQPVSAAGALAATADADGNIVVFTVSTGGNILCLRPSQASGAGWSQIPTGLQGSQIGVGLTQSGTLLVVTPDAEVITFVEQTASGWSSPQNVLLPTQNINGNDPVSVGAQNFGGKLYITYFQPGNVPAVQPGGPYLGSICTWDDAGKTLADPFSVPLLDAFSLRAGVDPSGNLGFFSVATPQIYTSLSNSYQSAKIYSDRGSKAQMHIAFWRPNVTGGFYLVGDYAASGYDYNYGPPTTPTLLIQRSLDWSGTIPDLLYNPQPAEFVQVWNSNKFGSSEQGSIWYPVHANYVSLGCVSNPTMNEPSSLPAVMMARQDLAVPATVYKKDPTRVSDQPEGENDLLIYGSWGASGTPLAVDAISPNAGSVAAGTFYAHPDFNVPQGPAYCLAQTTAVNSIVVRFDPSNPDHQSNATAFGPATARAVVASSATEDSNGITHFFAIMSDGGLYLLDPSAGTWVSLDQSRVYQTLAASLDASGLLEVFAVGSDRALYHVRQDTAAASGWGPVLEVDRSQQYAQLSVARDGQGNSHAFLTTASGALIWVLQDPSTTAWMVSEVELSDLDNVQDVRTFTTEITVTDANLIPQPSSQVTIWSDDLVPASVNNSGSLLDRQPVNFTTDYSGKVTVTVQTTNLSAPILYVNTPAMTEGENIAIQPNASIQATLQAVDGPTLVTQLGVPESNADQVAAAVRTAMSLAQPQSSGTAASLRYISRNRDLRGITYRTDRAQPSPGRINPALLPEQHWRIEVHAGQVMFRTLTQEEAQSLRAGQRANLPSVESVLSWFGDLGDLVQSIIEGIVSEFTYTISVISTGIEAAVTFVLNGIKYVWDFTVNLVEQAFEIVESIFAALKVAFDDLVSWLGFLFNWQDILRTKEAVSWTIQQTLPFMKDIVGMIQQNADNGIQQLKSELQSSVNQVLTAFGPDQSVAAWNSQYGTQPAAFDSAAGTNIVLTGFMANAGAVALPGAARFGRGATSGSAPDPVSNLVNLIQAQTAPNGQFVQSEGFTKATAYFSQIAAQPDQFVQLTFAGLVSALEGVAEAALDLAQSLVDQICAAISALIDWFLQLLTEPWNVPFVSTLYQTYIAPGSQLTALDLFALILAVPVTVVYKVSYGAAPFPTDADLAAFTGSYTTAWLQQVSGLGGAGTGAIKLSAPNFKDFFAVSLGLTFLVYAGLEAVLDAFVVAGLPGATDPPEALGIGALVFEVLIWGFSNPWADPTNTTLPGCGSKTAAANLLWCTTGGLPFVIDGGIFLVSGLLPQGSPTVARNWGTAGVFIDFFVDIVATTSSLVSIGLTGMNLIHFFSTLLNGLLSGVKVVRAPVISEEITILTGGAVTPQAVALLSGLADFLGDFIGIAAASPSEPNPAQAGAAASG